jgi:hypothetical protein
MDRWTEYSRSGAVIVATLAHLLTVRMYNKCGHTPCPEVNTFKLVNGPLDPETGEQEHVVTAAAGITFTLFLTARGKST